MFYFWGNFEKPKLSLQKKKATQSNAFAVDIYGAIFISKSS